MITSAANPHVRMMRSLGRRRPRHTERAFLVEGHRLVEDAVRHGASVRSLLVREDQPAEWVASLGVEQARVRVVEGAVFDAASDVEHSQGVAAICDFPSNGVTAADLAGATELVLVLDRLRDPGNMGTALRSAAAAGVRIVLVGPGCVDPTSPKVVRAGMGAHFRLRIAPLGPELLAALAEADGDVVFADPSADTPYHAHSWENTRALVVGGETESLSPALTSIVSRRVAIPMSGDVESLNAGVAASVLLFKAKRQRAG